MAGHQDNCEGTSTTALEAMASVVAVKRRSNNIAILSRIRMKELTREINIYGGARERRQHTKLSCTYQYQAFLHLLKYFK